MGLIPKKMWVCRRCGRRIPGHARPVCRRCHRFFDFAVPWYDCGDFTITVVPSWE